MNPTNHPALEEGRLAHLVLPNRAVVAPMSRVSAHDNGIPTPLMAAYYGRFAEGGFALIITEGTYTDRVFSQGYAKQPGITDSAQIEAWRSVVQRVHQAGGRILLQIMHAGALSQFCQRTIAPSAVPPRGHMLESYGGKGTFPLPHAASRAELGAARDGFAAAATNAQAAGFDGVEIHGANGYLLDQFLTDYTNQRQDEYGGTITKRVRFLTEVITAVCAAVHSPFIVGVRLSQGKVNDFDYLWTGGEEDAALIFPAVANAGADYIHFATGGNGYRHGSYTKTGACLPRLARQYSRLPVLANGGLHNPDESRRILTEQEADFVALGVEALANPDWPHRLQRGQVLAPLPKDYFHSGVTLEKTGLPGLT